jgi:hypothetical protein
VLSKSKKIANSVYFDVAASSTDEEYEKARLQVLAANRTVRALIRKNRAEYNALPNVVLFNSYSGFDRS